MSTRKGTSHSCEKMGYRNGSRDISRHVHKDDTLVYGVIVLGRHKKRPLVETSKQFIY